MGTSERLRRQSSRLWEAIHAHPFVRGLGAGSLPSDRFTFYLRQDYLFLIAYSRVLALAAAKAPDLESMAKFGELMHATATREIALHRRYCAGFGISGTALERTRIAPGTVAYTHYLLAIGYNGTFNELCSALLPCQWGYAEIGERLAKAGGTKQSNPYAEWVRMYASKEFQALAAWLRGYLDTRTKRASMETKAQLHRAFETSSRFEYQFWEMAWTKQGWPA